MACNAYGQLQAMQPVRTGLAKNSAVSHVTIRCTLIIDADSDALMKWSAMRC
jgi:hypothetical protein